MPKYIVLLDSSLTQKLPEQTVHTSDLLQSLAFHKCQSSTNSPYVLWQYFPYWCPSWYNDRQAADLFLVFNLVPRWRIYVTENHPLSHNPGHKWCSVSMVLQIIKTKWQLIMLHVAHLLHCRMTSNSTNRLNALVLSWHKIPSFIVVAIGLLHSQPFTYSHCHFLFMVELVNSKCYFSDPNKEIDDTDIQYVKLHCHVEGSQLITDRFFRPLKQHWSQMVVLAWFLLWQNV
jgi:hypothetical protein